MTRYIFFTGGVVSSLGKGLAAASLGALLQARGLKVKIRKLDGYLNVDPGTMNPYQHGEVFVTEDGAETDLDLGHYERFTGVDHLSHDVTTMGKIYANILKKERRGDYLGGTVQVVPHVIDEIKDFIKYQTEDLDFLIGEIGGTVGDIESLPYLEAIRQLAIDVGRENVLFIHLTLMPHLQSTGELKTKATQHSVRMLLSLGIQPDMLLCRTDHSIPMEMRKKLGLFCNVSPNRVFEAKTAPSIYAVPIAYHQEGIDTEVCKFFHIETKEPDLLPWEHVYQNIKHAPYTTTIAVVGKYVELPDAYKSLNEALLHGGFKSSTKVVIDYIDAEDIEKDKPSALARLGEASGILVPGGFGTRGIEGKIKAIHYARTKKIPFLGICLGMQMAIVEATRHLLNLKNANSTEFGKTDEPVVGLMQEWMSQEGLQERNATQDLGGTMRLGSYPCVIKENSLAQSIYQNNHIKERHRHRYEVNTRYKESLEEKGIIFSGMSEDGLLPEIIEIKDHPFFIGVQFHPELKSRPLLPHPLFTSFIEASAQNQKTRRAA